ncbi:hypothetical protein JCGZ_19390 [Jatropha curcas]|uniref:Uncharacterized protein n=1 Tax=Jatropha curcas TaxID=180498 RepID=A0A067JZJ8_JATCU|nr:hypothetical protein JCGZ_19390 [Jatropha curcas]
MAPKKITINSNAARTGASNSLNVRSTADSSPNTNIKTKSVTEIYAKVILCLNKSLDSVTGKIQMFEKDESASKESTPPKETLSKKTQEKGFKLIADGSISTIQLKELIKDALKDQLETTM